MDDVLPMSDLEIAHQILDLGEKHGAVKVKARHAAAVEAFRQDLADYVAKLRVELGGGQRG